MSRVWVLVYYLQVITWLVGLCILEKYEQLFFTLAYLFGCLIVVCVVLLLLRWSSIYWCEHMREVLEVNREVMIPLLSIFGRDSSFLVGLRPMYCFTLGFIWFSVNLLLHFVFGIVMCLVSLLSLFEQLYGARFILQDRAIIFLCDAYLIRVIN